MTVLLDLRKRRGMSLDRLTDTPFPTIQLHGTLDLECRWVGRVSRNTNKDEPFFIGGYTVVDNLGAGESRMAVKDLLGRILVGDGPVVHSRFGDHANGRFRDPLPENDILVVYVRLDLLLAFNVEDL